MTSSDTSMTLTGVRSGLRIDAQGTSGTLSAGSSVSAVTGYAIAAKETNEGLSYDVVSVVADRQAQEPPTLAISVDYSQSVAISEVDLDLRYTDIPDGTSVQVACSETEFDISKQPISGSSLIGSSGKGLGAFDSSIDLRLWITRPDALKTGASLTLSMSKIDGGDGGPVKKVLLQKIALNLAQ